MDASFVTTHKSFTVVDKDTGVRFDIADVRIDTTRSDGESMTMEYTITGPKGANSVAWLKRNFPDIYFTDPEAERLRAAVNYHNSIRLQGAREYVSWLVNQIDEAVETEVTREAARIIKDHSLKQFAKPCKGVNTNICVAEGCYGEACVKNAF